MSIETGTRIFTGTRVVALVLIAGMVGGLAYLRLSPEDRAVRVPSGATAGDLTLEPCTYDTEAGELEADCGTLVVPENRAEPEGRLIALPVVRIPARSDHPGAPIFLLWGGPGLTNLDWPHASRYVENHDVVMVGYRGVDGSVRLDCPEVESAIKSSTGVLDEKGRSASVDAYRSCANRLTGEGIDLAQYGLVQQTDDMESARMALGYDRIDLLSESAGTRTAQIYAQRYPDSIHRSVMVAVNPPGHFLWYPQTTDEQIARYADLCSKDVSCSSRTDDIAQTMAHGLANIPDRWLFFPIEDDYVRLGSLIALFESTDEEPLNGPMALSSFMSAADGDYAGLWMLSFAADFFLPESFVWGQYRSGGRLDAESAREYFSEPRDTDSVADALNSFVWVDGRLVDGWPAIVDEDEYSEVQTSEVETLLVGGELDLSTPPQVASKELLPHLKNGHEVVLPGFSHTVTFWGEQPEAGTHLITTFFDTGRVDDSLYTAQRVDVTPEFTLASIAKAFVATLATLVLLTLLSLAWMARRVRKTGSFGRRSGAVLRTVHPIVLGLGGWSAGVLLVLAALPTVSFDNELVTVVSVGLPIWLGVYLAWVHRDRPARTKVLGLRAAGLGTFLGAWLGFHAGDGLTSLITAIAGAVTGANLFLILLDIATTRAARDAMATARPLDEPRADVGHLVPTGIGSS